MNNALENLAQSIYLKGYDDALSQESRWIPVSERLPNFNDIVLASTDSDYEELGVILTVYGGEEFWFNGKIKAWMPKPKQYTAESEVKEMNEKEYYDLAKALGIDFDDAFRLYEDLKDKDRQAVTNAFLNNRFGIPVNVLEGIKTDKKERDFALVVMRKGQWLRMSDLSEQEDDRYKCSRCGNVVHHKDKMDLYTFNRWCGRCGSDNGR